MRMKKKKEQITPRGLKMKFHGAPRAKPLVPCPTPMWGDIPATRWRIPSRPKAVVSRCRDKKEKGSILKGIPKGLPPLSLAYQLTEKASRLGFDWPDLKGVLKKLDEEMEEFREALSIQNRKKIREEIGDLLFVLVNIARFLGIQPEEALRKTIEKFTSRFYYIETSLRKEGKTFHQTSLIEMDRLWEEAKKIKNR